MASPESDAHGRIHRSVDMDIDYSDVAAVTPGMEQESEDDFVTFSNGARIPKYAVEDYLASFDSGDGVRKFDKVDAIVFGSVATMSAMALTIAIRRLRKNQ